jgi:hypothetical protein
MALKDMKSNLAKGVGTPKGSPTGNIPNESKVTSDIKSKVGKLRNKLIDQSTPEVLKYTDLTANGKKA